MPLRASFETGVVAEYGHKYDSAVACFMNDFEARYP
jgi:hypothetical protein